MIAPVKYLVSNNEPFKSDKHRTCPHLIHNSYQPAVCCALQQSRAYPLDKISVVTVINHESGPTLVREILYFVDGERFNVSPGTIRAGEKKNERRGNGDGVA